MASTKIESSGTNKNAARKTSVMPVSSRRMAADSRVAARRETHTSTVVVVVMSDPHANRRRLHHWSRLMASNNKNETINITTAMAVASAYSNCSSLVIMSSGAISDTMGMLPAMKITEPYSPTPRAGAGAGPGGGAGGAGGGGARGVI